jgi:hypothetical protein
MNETKIFELLLVSESAAQHCSIAAEALSPRSRSAHQREALRYGEILRRLCGLKVPSLIAADFCTTWRLPRLPF